MLSPSNAGLDGGTSYRSTRRVSGSRLAIHSGATEKCPLNHTRPSESSAIEWGVHPDRVILPRAGRRIVRRDRLRRAEQHPPPTVIRDVDRPGIRVGHGNGLHLPIAGRRIQNVHPVGCTCP